ncbi:PEGA domain-containing protein [Myxococcota bacterium]|nr:PEGA domain-containing protein [Myxococcota bacterium]
MTDQGGGKRQPADDRTLLDPLNADELKALREARQKMQAAKGAVQHQVVIGPDAGEDIGDAPTRAMPALPQFDNPGVTLEKIPTGSMPAVSRTPGQGTPRSGVAPQQPMSMAPTVPSGQHAGPPGPAAGPSGPVAGPTGFGENTLMWMSPPKVPQAAGTNPGATGMTGEMKAVKGASSKRTLMGVAFVAVLAVVIGGLYFAFAKKERATIDLHTNPPKASVKINDTPTKNQTPMKLTLNEGTWDIEVSLDGHKTEKFSINVDAALLKEVAEKGGSIRRDVELEPISREGMMTVQVNVQPVAANITLDGTVYTAKRLVNVANVDPQQPHKLVIEAGGYVKIEQDIPAGQLKKAYNFILQKDETQKLGEGAPSVPTGQPTQPQQ